MSRQNVPEKIANLILVANHHTCCICRERRKHVQLHHVDGNHSNNDPDNLAVVCLDDHSRVTGNEGLGRRFTPGEVEEYKRQWEAMCANVEEIDDEDDDNDESYEPLTTCFQSRRIKAQEDCAFTFDMEAGQQLVASISADGYVDVSICAARDYKKWRDGHDLFEYEGDEDVRECELPTFTAPKDGKFVVAIFNNGDDDVDVAVDISIWEKEDDDEDQE